MTRFNQREIYDCGKGQAHEQGLSSAASRSDQCVIEMEIGEIVKRLADEDRVLDVACANGYSSLQFACARRIRLRGLDYIPKMIEEARLRLDRMKDRLVGTVEFHVGDITELKEPSEA